MENKLKLSEIKNSEMQGLISDLLFNNNNIVLKEDLEFYKEGMEEDCVYLLISKQNIEITFSDENEFAQNERDEYFTIAMSMNIPTRNDYNNVFLDILNEEFYNESMNKGE